MAVPVTTKPTIAVCYLTAPKRQSNSRVMKSTWNCSNYSLNEDYGARITKLQIDWFLGIKGTDIKKTILTENERINQSSINLNSFTVGSKTYTRADFYPFANKPKLNYVTIAVWSKNEKGLGLKATQTREFKLPKKPTIDAFTYDAETGIVSTVIRTDAGLGNAERYDTRYKVTVKDTRTGNSWTQYDTSSTSTVIPVSYNVADRDSLSYSEYVKVTVTAWSRGYVGASDTVSRTYYVAYPAQVTINSIKLSGTDYSTSKCTVHISTNNSKTHPVDRVRLDYLADTEYADANLIPASAVWTLSNIIDDAKCYALAIPISEIMPDRGHYTWIRVTSWHADERLSRYSKYMRVKQLELKAATVTDDKIDIISADAGPDGESIVVRLGWNKDGQDDATGTELTWSDSEDTWRSTDEPKVHVFTWSDGTYTHGSTTYQDSALITIKGLDEGTKYYIRARRYMEGDVTTYSDYSNDATCVTSETPENIVATCDKYVSVGSSLVVRWTFSGNALQREWMVVEGTGFELTTDTSIVNGRRYYEYDSTTQRYEEVTPSSGHNNPSQEGWYVLENGAVIVGGEGSYGSTEIEEDRLSTFAVNGQVMFTVLVSTGSGFVQSGTNVVSIVSKPELSVSGSDVMESQASYSFDATVSSLCDLSVIVSSQGASGQFPQGILTQINGDTIYSNLYNDIEWETSSDSLISTVTLPDNLNFWDGASYTITVVAIDRTTGLKSEEQTIDLTVDWDDKAVDPSTGVTLTPVDEIDSTTGDHIQGVLIDLTPPTGSSSSDVYDIYRMDVGKPTLIGEGFPLTYSGIDYYAPFGHDLDLYYRIALRTVDGDVEFADISYQAESNHIRFDWANSYVELPYNMSFGDTYKKNVDIRQHMDGAIDGFWNLNVERKSSLSSAVLKIIQPDVIEKVRKLARHTGAVFVRLPDGSAYEADVQVTDLSRRNEAVANVAFDATEVNLTNEFSLPIPFIEDDNTSGDTSGDTSGETGES